MFTLRIAKPLASYVTQRERYKVDLPRQMAECEMNYVRLQKILSQHFANPRDAQAAQDYRFVIASGQTHWHYEFLVQERSPYTTSLRLLLRQTTSAALSPWLGAPQLSVRMYHDAQLAEVLSAEGHKTLRPRYEYPNQCMYHVDEKLQINQFLGELLARCLSHGHGSYVMPPDLGK